MAAKQGASSGVEIQNPNITAFKSITNVMLINSNLPANKKLRIRTVFGNRIHFQLLRRFSPFFHRVHVISHVIAENPLPVNRRRGPHMLAFVVVEESENLGAGVGGNNGSGGRWSVRE